jgi:hypothetical protein
MHMLITETKNKVRPVSRLLLLGMAILIIACGGGLDGATEDNEPPPDIRQTSSWESFNIVALDSDPITPKSTYFTMKKVNYLMATKSAIKSNMQSGILSALSWLEKLIPSTCKPLIQRPRETAD